MENRQKQLIGNTAILLIGRISTQFLSFFMLPVYTSVLSPSEYGIVDLFNTYVVLLLPIVNFQIDYGLFRYMLDARASEEQQKSLFTTVLLCNTFSVIAYSILYLLVSPLIHSEYKIFLLLHVILTVFSTSLLQFARGRGKNVAYTVGSFLTALITVLLNILLVAILRIGAMGMLWSVVGGQAAVIIYLFFSQRVWHYFHPQLFDFQLLKRLLRYSLPLVPANLSWWVIDASDRSIISYVLGIAANGIYTVANKFSSLISIVYTIFDMAWTETVSLHIHDEDRDSFISGVVNRLYNFFFSVCICLIALIPFLFPLLINRQYNDAYPYIPILIVAVFSLILCGLFNVMFLAMKNTKESAKTAFYAAIINVAVNWLLIKRFGLYAAAGSTFIAYTAMAIYRYITVQKYVRIHIRLRYFLSSLVMIAVILPAYYSGQTVLKVAALGIAAAYALIMNRTMIRGAWRMVIGKLRKGNS